jgi:hypothetical protein
VSVVSQRDDAGEFQLELSGSKCAEFRFERSQPAICFGAALDRIRAVASIKIAPKRG